MSQATVLELSTTETDAHILFVANPRRFWAAR